MARAMKDTTARLLAEQLRSAEQRVERYEAALRGIIARTDSDKSTVSQDVRRIAQQATE